MCSVYRDEETCRGALSSALLEPRRVRSLKTKLTSNSPKTDNDNHDHQEAESDALQIIQLVLLLPIEDGADQEAEPGDATDEQEGREYSCAILADQTKLLHSKECLSLMCPKRVSTACSAQG